MKNNYFGKYRLHSGLHFSLGALYFRSFLHLEAKEFSTSQHGGWLGKNGMDRLSFKMYCLTLFSFSIVIFAYINSVLTSSMTIRQDNYRYFP